jgi:hypothetical protein
VIPLHNSNIVYTELLKKSLLTNKQLAIIYKKVQAEKFDSSISAGAYYRQVAQCKSKIKRTVYTILLLHLISSLEQNAFITMDKLVSQLSVICSDVNLSNLSTEDVINVIRTVDDIVDKLVDM